MTSLHSYMRITCWALAHSSCGAGDYITDGHADIDVDGGAMDP